MHSALQGEDKEKGREILFAKVGYRLNERRHLKHQKNDCKMAANEGGREFSPEHQIEGENKSSSNSLSDGNEQKNDKTIFEVNQNYLPPNPISSHRHGFVAIGVSIFIRGFLFLFICLILFRLSQCFMEWFMTEGLEYLKYGRRLSWWERTGYQIGQWWERSRYQIGQWLYRKLWK